MKMSGNKTFFLCILIIATGQSAYKVEAASRLFSRDPEFSRQQNQSPKTDPELNLANNLDNLRQQQQQQQQQQQPAPYQQQANFVRRQLFTSNNGPDVAPLSPYPSRHQQLKPQQTDSPLYNQASQQFPLLQLQFEDEHAMRRRLPELIAQAHTDKNIERALLKMLINQASSRSALTNGAAADSYGSSGSYGWRQDNGSETGNGLDNSVSSPISARMSARLDQVFDEFSGSDPVVVSNDLGSPQLSYIQDQQHYVASPVGKREYIKPCFFNAVACAKNPFRDRS